ncbi:MAG: hypothetical protein WC139_09700 [Candidatus Kapaibacterium sp.]
MIKINQITPLNWKRLFVSIFLISIANAFREVFLNGFGRVIPYLTYYPAVMAVAVKEENSGSCPDKSGFCPPKRVADPSRRTKNAK